MSLAAAQVVAVIASRLNGATVAAANVFTDRSWPLDASQLPAWKVVAGDEEISRAVLGAQVHEDFFEIEAEARVHALSDIDQAMNAIVAEALPALFAAPVPYDLELKGIRRKPASEGQADIGLITLVLGAHFFFDAAAPETILSTP